MSSNSETPQFPGGNSRSINNRARSPWVILACGFLIGLGAGIGVDPVRRLHQSGNDQTVRAPTAASVSTKAVESPRNAISVVDGYLKTGQLQDAYDALLVAMRLAPGDPTVFGASLKFIRTAAGDDRDDSLDLAQDVYQRAAALLPFLPLDQLRKARGDHTKVGASLLPKKQETKPEDPLAEAERMIVAAERPDLPSFVRNRLLHDVDLELGSQAVQAASRSYKPGDASQFWSRWKSVKDRYDKSQETLLGALYQDDCRPKLQAWLNKVQKYQPERGDAHLDEVHKMNAEILDLMGDGQRIVRDLAPYLEAKLTAAVQDNRGDAIDKQLVRLSQLREWNYNRWALDRVGKVEQSSGSPLNKLKSLSIVDEARLSPYTGQRLADAWKKLFDECSKDDKFEATRLRILKGYQ